MNKPAFVYIMASRRNGTLYLGVTSNLIGRVWQHRTGASPGFAREYGCKTLVWFEAHGDLESARLRERQMKRWKRLWKLARIEAANPDWLDLYPTLFEGS